MHGIDKFRHKLNIYRRYRYWSKSGCIFIHVPKAAGTSINRAIYGRTLGHYRAAEIEDKFPSLYSDCFTFSFVRNPWDRLYSAYKFAKSGGTESMGVANPRRYRIPEFECFERFVFEWFYKKDLVEEDYIFQPQYSFVCDEGLNLMVDYVGKIESLDKDILFVENKLSRGLDVGYVNATKKGGGIESVYTSADMIELVRLKYSKDIELFNYDEFGLR
ncbi:MAG: sulfotransferase family protein [Gammaproteobacteria bacterium]|nr:sulfotransferase family protein [Gammaproteobacteria bacterium]